MGELLLNLWLPHRKAEIEPSDTQTQFAWGEVYLKHQGSFGTVFLGRTHVATFSRDSTHTETDTDRHTLTHAHERTPEMRVKSAVSHFSFSPFFFKGSSEEERVGSRVTEQPAPSGEGVEENVSTIHLSFVPAETLDQVFFHVFFHTFMCRLCLLKLSIRCSYARVCVSVCVGVCVRARARSYILIY